MYEGRNFIELMGDYKLRLLSEIKNALTVKPLFKARLRLHIWITNAKEASGIKLIGKHYDYGQPRDVFETAVTTKDYKLINNANYEDELTALIHEMDERRKLIFSTPSGWRLLKYFFTIL